MELFFPPSLTVRCSHRRGERATARSSVWASRVFPRPVQRDVVLPGFGRVQPGTHGGKLADAAGVGSAEPGRRRPVADAANRALDAAEQRAEPGRGHIAAAAHRPFGAAEQRAERPPQQRTQSGRSERCTSLPWAQQRANCIAFASGFVAKQPGPEPRAIARRPHRGAGEEQGAAVGAILAKSEILSHRRSKEGREQRGHKGASVAG